MIQKRVSDLREYLFAVYKILQQLCLGKSIVAARFRGGIGDTLICSPALQLIKNDSTFVIFGCRPKQIEPAMRISGPDLVLPEKTLMLLGRTRILRSIIDLEYHNELYREKSVRTSLPEAVAAKVSAEGELPSIQYELQEDERKFADDILKKLGPFIVFSPDCNYARERKEWIPEYWQELASIAPLPILVLGTSDFEIPDAHDLRGKTSLSQAAAVINECTLFVGSVSGLFWFTHAFGKPAVVINGGFEPPELTGHALSRHIYNKVECAPCLEAGPCEFKLRCMREIEPRDVLSVIAETLAANNVLEEGA